MRYDAVLTQAAHEQACALLLGPVSQGHLQEELCFALWRPSTGKARTSALIFKIVPPMEGEHHLHGNASFESAYLTRVIRLACSRKVGVAFMHNHLGPGWQDMSAPDVVAERDRISSPSWASGLPLVGLTLGTDGSWSARFWIRSGNAFIRHWCDKVRVVGRRLEITYNDREMTAPIRHSMLRRTIDTWGEARQKKIARLRVGVVGVGSVGCMVAESLARIGIGKITLIDHDKVEEHNLDRLLYAGVGDIGRSKVELASEHLKRSATAENFQVDAYAGEIQERDCYHAALDCDLLFVAVDRPLPKDLLNHIAYAHCIPIIFGGVYAANKTDGTLGQAAWSTVVAGPHRRCLRCDGQYTSSDVVLEKDGSWDNPGYLQDAQGNASNAVNQNVFPFSANLASLMVLEMIRMLVAEAWWPDTGDKSHYSLIPNRLEHPDGACHENCSISEKLAFGDAVEYPFLVSSPLAEEPQKVWQKLVAAICEWRRYCPFLGGKK